MGSGAEAMLNYGREIAQQEETETHKSVKTVKRPNAKTHKRKTVKLGRPLTLVISAENRKRLVREASIRKEREADNWRIRDVVDEALDAFFAGK